MRDLALLLLRIIGGACSLGLFGWFVNRYFGWSVGSKYNDFAIPTEWQAGLSFFIGAVVCFGIVWIAGRKK